MKCKRLCLGLVLCGLMLLFSAACAQPQETLLIYMIGSDLESENGYASSDLREMTQALCAGGKLDVLLCAGGAARWHNGLPAGHPAVYRLTPDGPEPLWTMPHASMTDGETLQAFLDYAAGDAASSTALLFWNHGGGPLVGFGYDESDPDDRLTFSEIRRALSASFARERKLAWIGFDACLMGTLEMAVLAEPYAQYLIASEEVEMGCGWNYRFISRMAEGIDTPSLSKIILDDFYDSTVAACGGNAQLMPTITLACYDLSALPKLAQSMDALAEKMDTSLVLGSFASLARSRASIPSAGRFSGGLNTDLIDLERLLKTLHVYYPDEVQAVRSALSDTVISLATNNAGVCGMSVYFPFGDREGYVAGLDRLYQELMPLDAYRGFVRSFAGEWLKGASDEPIALKAVPVSSLSVQLDEDVADSMSSAYYVIAQEFGSYGYGPYYVGDNVTLDGNILTAHYQMETAFVFHKEERFPLHITKLEEDDTRSWYEIPAWVSRFRPPEYALEQINLQIVLEKETGHCTVIGAYAAETSGLGKHQIDLSQWDTIQFLFAGFLPARAPDGTLLPFYDWQSQHVFGVEYDLEESFEIGFAPIEDLPSDLYCQLIVRDVYGNDHASDLLLVQSGQGGSALPSVEQLVWEDQSEPLLLTDNSLMTLLLAQVDTESGASFTLLARNKTETPLILRLNTLALNDVGFSPSKTYYHLPVGEWTQWVVPTEDYPFQYAGTDCFSRLRMSYDIQSEKHLALEENLLTDVALTWRFHPPQENALSFGVHMTPALLFENEVLRISSTGAATLAYADANHAYLYFRIDNLTQDMLHVDLDAAVSDGQTLDLYQHFTPLPGVSSFAEVWLPVEALRENSLLGTHWGWIIGDPLYAPRHSAELPQVLLVRSEP